MQRTDPRRVPQESLFRPCFKLWSLVVFGEYDFLYGESKKGLIGTELRRFYRSDAVEDTSRQKIMQLAANYLEVF